MSRRRTETGSIALESVLTLPLLAVVLLGVLQLAGVIRDELLAQEAARTAVRVAVTTRTSAPVVAAAAEAAAPRTVTTSVVPRSRRPGELARVEVRLPGSFGPFRTTAVGRAVGRVEPGAVP